MYIISALRTAYVNEKITGIPETDLLSKACWNVLSHAATDLNEIDVIVLQGDNHPSKNFEIHKFDDLAHQLFHSEKLKLVNASNTFQILFDAIANEHVQKILIGIANFNDYGNYLGDEVSECFEDRLLAVRKEQPNLQYQELIPFETTTIGQGLNLIEKARYVEGEKRVRSVNGVGAILLSKEPTLFAGIYIRQLIYTKQLTTDAANLMEGFAEQIILEADYLNARHYEKFITVLEKKLQKSLRIHDGGSIVYGNSPHLNGLRAITASVSKLHSGILNVAIAVAITGEDEGYILVLDQRSES